MNSELISISDIMVIERDEVLRLLAQGDPIPPPGPGTKESSPFDLSGECTRVRPHLTEGGIGVE